ncbi:hypothetical protein [Caballeronia sp. LZ034LL]|uniref:hypothetical protein n=1 Tax=Caballeronia sp. LZ034LL TaxID=3038567 RepID=UPI002866816B|nr:hypothetical protein [Caballeronia sp. LZ034LL]MDR5839346.1 hypothetical protein [Caballeronia sp. LZ034LL]
MTREEELASFMLKDYLSWLVTERKSHCLSHAKLYVKAHTPVPSKPYIERVAYALLKQGKHA